LLIHNYFVFTFILFLSLTHRPPPTSTLFPYTTLFRSLISTTSASPRRSIAMRVVSSGTALKTTVLYFGAPRRQWDGTASSLTWRSEEHTSELQSRFDLVCRLLLEKKKKNNTNKEQ